MASISLKNLTKSFGAGDDAPRICALSSSDGSIWRSDEFAARTPSGM